MKTWIICPHNGTARPQDHTPIGVAYQLECSDPKDTANTFLDFGHFSRWLTAHSRIAFNVSFIPKMPKSWPENIGDLPVLYTDDVYGNLK